jgi:hypothetical protein
MRQARAGRRSGLDARPSTGDELNVFLQSGLELVSFDDFFDEEDPPVRRFRVQYQKPIEEKR